jgi:hypothetical protein
MGQMEMKCILNIGKKYFYIGQGYSGERCGPWASCLISFLIFIIIIIFFKVVKKLLRWKKFLPPPFFELLPTCLEEEGARCVRQEDSRSCFESPSYNIANCRWVMLKRVIFNVSFLSETGLQQQRSVSLTNGMIERGMRTQTWAFDPISGISGSPC